MLGGYVLLNDPDLIRRVLVDNAANYPKDRLQLEKLTPAVGRGLLTAEPESWRLQRRTVAPLFQPLAVTSYLASMAASLDEMLARWERHAQAGATVIDVAREMTTLTYDIISRTVFSHEIETPADVMAEALTAYFEAFGRIDLWDVLPLPRWLPRPASIRARPAQKIFREEVRRLVDRRRVRMTAGQSVPDDLVTRLMNARDPETDEAADRHGDPRQSRDLHRRRPRDHRECARLDAVPALGMSRRRCAACRGSKMRQRRHPRPTSLRGSTTRA